MIRLRDYTESDIQKLTQLANNKNVSRYMIDTFPYPYTRDDAAWWVHTGASANGAVTKVIEVNNEFVGSVGILPQTGWKRHCAEIGYWVGEPFWGKGIATKALQEMSNLASEQHGIRKLFAPVLGPNIASMRVLEKGGYVLEGVLKQEVYKDGTYYDIHHFAKIVSNQNLNSDL